MGRSVERGPSGRGTVGSTNTTPAWLVWQNTWVSSHTIRAALQCQICVYHSATPLGWSTRHRIVTLDDGEGAVKLGFMTWGCPVQKPLPAQILDSELTIKSSQLGSSLYRHCVTRPISKWVLFQELLHDTAWSLIDDIEVHQYATRTKISGKTTAACNKWAAWVDIDTQNTCLTGSDQIFTNMTCELSFSTLLYPCSHTQPLVTGCMQNRGLSVLLLL